MGHSQVEKAQNRERILAEAARQARDEGLESISVGALMKSVGLTHGGFYGHFESRSALLAEALEQALTDGESRARSHAGSGPHGFADMFRSYLSRTHRDSRDRGCAMAALACDVARANEASRRAMETHVEAFIAGTARTLDGDERKAMLAVSAMIGALALSRVLTDPARSDALLRAVRSELAKLETVPPSSERE
ncbi:MAG TPA: TetR/AcrR family transcriptional regulator [Caulobacteraceae bacterium]|nr:TetR/AcrR family transcriptional regulator [Caulobacteraceae bacterium]